MPQRQQHCMLLHGLISTPAEFSAMRAPLAQRGIQLHTPVLPGYSYTKNMQPRRWQDWLAEGEQLLADTVSDGQAITLGGLCIGSILALALAAEHPGRVNKLVLLSPTLYYDGWGLSRWRWMRQLGYLPGLRRWLGTPEREPYGVKNPQIRKWIARELEKQAVSAAGAAKLPLWAVHEAERLIAHTKRQLHRIDARSLILHAREDEVTSLRSPEYLVAKLGENRTRFIILENSYHMVTLDNDRQLVNREIADFMLAKPDIHTITANNPTFNLMQGNQACQQP
ncbi:alpha/beta hydrolase [Chitinimonas sp. BJB300]|uniref:alpha/beta hydrolase n=1 Tax=Chitinimonas sp. BJB300 TaxID=1559339 RepID=UPI00130455B4|nr:alpha/beta hydrolase [Chitinimonas sp. BJB300]